jgi:uncharacterized membrane-anchored protein YhcB (DUF1043 family)
LAAKSAKSASPTNWAFLVVGLIVGAPIGMVVSASVRKRRKKQTIFG